jgi:hypothetical protein
MCMPVYWAGDPHRDIGRRGLPEPDRSRFVNGKPLTRLTGGTGGSANLIWHGSFGEGCEAAHHMMPCLTLWRQCPSTLHLP